MRAVVSDASPLIFLFRIGLVSLPKRLFGEVYAPEAVIREIGAKPDELTAILSSGGLSQVSITDRRAADALKTFLGPGEAEAIVLAQELQASLLLTDDKRARKVAEAWGLKVVGTLGLLVEAHERCLVPDALSALNRLRDVGMWIDEPLYREVLRRLGACENQ